MSNTIPAPQFFPIGFDYLNEQFRFSVLFGGQQFSYSGGFRAFVKDYDAAKARVRRVLGEHSRAASMLQKYERGQLKWSKNAGDPDTQRVIAAFQPYQKPEADGFLYSLLMDMDAGEMNFRDFCDNFGYNDDSIKDLDTHRECEATARKIRKVLTQAQIDELRERLKDY